MNNEEGVVKDDITEEEYLNRPNFSLTMDAFSQALVAVAFHFLLFRVFSVFLFAYLFAHEWYWQKVAQWFYIIAFKVTPGEFETMNSYAVLTATIVMLTIFIFSIFFSAPRYFHRTLAWYAGVLMSAAQYFVLVLLNPKFNFGIRDDLQLEFLLIVACATAIMLVRYHVWVRRLRRYTEKNNISETQES